MKSLHCIEACVGAVSTTVLKTKNVICRGSPTGWRSLQRAHHADVHTNASNRTAMHSEYLDRNEIVYKYVCLISKYRGHLKLMKYVRIKYA